MAEEEGQEVIYTENTSVVEFRLCGDLERVIDGNWAAFEILVGISRVVETQAISKGVHLEIAARAWLRNRTRTIGDYVTPAQRKKVLQIKAELDAVRLEISQCSRLMVHCEDLHVAELSRLSEVREVVDETIVARDETVEATNG